MLSSVHTCVMEDFMLAQKNRKLIDRNQLQEMVPICRSQLYKFMRAGDFPTPVYVGQKLAWYEDEVQEWMASRTRAPYGGRG